MTRASSLHAVLANLALAFAYVLLGRLALLQALPPGYATLIFFPSGMALAVLVMHGARLLPGVALGAFLLNLTLGPGHDGLTMAAIVGAGSALQTWLGQRALLRWSHPALAGAPHVLSFLLLAPLVCLTNATLSVGGLLALGLVTPEAAASNWVFWWAGDAIGMLIGAPLTWIVIGQPRRLWWARRWIVGLPLLIGGAAFVIFFQRVSLLEQRQQDHELQLAAQQLTDALQHQFDEHERLLTALGNLIAPVGRLERNEFTHLARSYVDSRADLALVSWAPRITGAERQAYEQWAAAHIRAGFQVRSLQANGTTVAAPAQTQYFVTSYVEPLSGNEQVLGLDMLSEPMRADLVRNAAARRKPTASEAIQLVQRPNSGAILLAQVVFTPGSSEAKGMLVAVIESEAYLKLTMSAPALAGLSAQIEDVSLPRQPKHIAGATVPNAAIFTHDLSLGGREYRITVSPTKAYLATHQRWQSWTVLGAGMMLTGLLGAFLLLISGQRVEIEQLVERRTRELQEREARLRALLDQAADAILTIGLDGSITSANSAAEHMFLTHGYGMAGQAIADLLDVGDTMALLAKLAQSRQRPASPGAPELQARRSDGARFPISISAARVELPGEAFYVCILHDLSEQQRAHDKILELEAFKRTQHELMTAERLSSLGALVAGVAHELNTPIGNSLLAATTLNDIVGGLQTGVESGTMKRSALQGQLQAAQSAAGLISGSLHRMAELITSFKQVAVDQTVDQRRSFALRPLAEAAAAAQASALARAHGTLTLDVPPTLELLSYPDSVGQVLSALLNNAIQHAFQGRQQGHIAISAYEDEQGMVRIMVRDDGVGMTPDILRRVFDPFFTTRLGQGSSGLGMNIVYNTVTGMLGGKIVVESEAGHGTTVMLMIAKTVAAPASATLQQSA